MRFALRTQLKTIFQMSQRSRLRRKSLYFLLGWVLLILVAMPWVTPWALPVFAQAPGTGNIFLPIVDQAGSGTAATATPVPIAGTPDDATDAEVVYGLLGEVQVANGQAFGHFFVTQGTRYYAIVGQTPAVESELDEIANRTPASPVKVWGALISGGAQVINPTTGESSGTLDLIIASSLLETAPTPTAPEGAAEEPVTATSKYNAVNLRAGPSLDYAPTSQIHSNDVCEVNGRNSDASWWLVRCIDGATGWVDARFVTVTGSTADIPLVDSPTVTPTPAPTSTPTPAPTPSPTQQVFTGWQTSFFSNPSLQGTPVAVVDVSSVNFDWGASVPYTNVPADNFSVRFQRQLTLPGGNYRFTVRADDGVRFWFDNQLFIDEWHSSTGQTYTASFSVVEGVHDLRVEYFESYGDASIFFTYEFVNAVGNWQADYYDNVSLTGNSVLSQSEPRGSDPLNYDWGYGSPQANVVPIDNWSARWLGQFSFSGGNYRFRATADDGVRVYIDGIQILDGWSDGQKDIDNMFYGVGSGTHEVRIEYYERSGTARIRVWWYQDAGAQIAP